MVVEPTRIQLYLGQHERQRSLEETHLAVCGVPTLCTCMRLNDLQHLSNVRLGFKNPAQEES